MGNIGIFWFYKNKVIGISHSYSLKDADSLGLIDSDFTHVEYWEEIKRIIPELKDKEYEELPRGRVIFNVNRGKTIIYLDKTLLIRNKVNQILEFFSLDFENTILKKDPHYKV